MDFIWQEDKKKMMYDKALSDTCELIRKLSNIRKLGFSRREDQYLFAKDVMMAIRDNKILIVQAGVGLGKSMGYIVPILSSYSNVNDFNKVIISTSNIALQQQLLTDINRISRLLKIDIRAGIAKGLNNYACLKRMDEIEASYCNNNNISFVLDKLRDAMKNKNTADRGDAGVSIDDGLWEKIQIRNRKECSGCIYSTRCLYKNYVKELKKSNIVITNHNYFANAICSNNDYLREFIEDASMYVIDEAHKLESSVRDIGIKKVYCHKMTSVINYFCINNFIDKDETKKLVSMIGKIYEEISDDCRNTFKSNDNTCGLEITDCNRIIINGKKFLNDIDAFVCELNRVISKISTPVDRIGDYGAKRNLEYMKRWCVIFDQLYIGDRSNYVFWAEFYTDDKINICYARKNNEMVMDKIFNSNIPVICTSATLLDAKGSYWYFKEGLGLNDNDRVVDGKVYSSPFNYRNNSLFYYDSSVANPKSDNYIDDLVVRIKELIRITDGKSLVLFTSKKVMMSVYDRVKDEDFGVNLLCQGQKADSKLCKDFSSDVNSCLFATGAFWEGIDIKGEALSSVIITRLPFPVVDAVTCSKANYFKDNSFEMVYLNEMVQKMAQGCGRLIRNKNDRGIICCLDSRVSNYLDALSNCLPYERYVNDISYVKKFSNRYIKKLGKK